MSHLVVSISGHGFGHVAQIAPILNLLHQDFPQLQLTVRSCAPVAHLRSRIAAPFAYLPSVGDIGMVMSSALDVLIQESRAAYRDFHADWERRVDDEQRLLVDLGADMVLSDVGYLALAGAQKAGIRNAALCSLNWYDIYRHYCGDDAVAADIHACYAGADAFLRATPGMAMENLPNLLPIAPIAAVGNKRRAELNRLLGVSAQEKLVLVSMGGIDSRLPVESWSRIKGVRWLVQKDWQVAHPDAIVIETVPMPFGDLLASCDVLLCKPGYGSFVEAACSGTPVLYVNRPDWPESGALTGWLQQHALCREISRDELYQGNFAAALLELCNARRPEPVKPGGARQVADWITERL
jgi:hypothetical protein